MRLHITKKGIVENTRQPRLANGCLGTRESLEFILAREIFIISVLIGPVNAIRHEIGETCLFSIYQTINDYPLIYSKGAISSLSNLVVYGEHQIKGKFYV